MNEHEKSGSPRPDPLIDEVRQLRKDLSEAFDNDIEKLGAHLQELQRKHPGRVVRRTPRVEPRRTA